MSIEGWFGYLVLSIFTLHFVVNALILAMVAHLWVMHLNPQKYGFATGLAPGDLDAIQETIRTELGKE